MRKMIRESTKEKVKEFPLNMYGLDYHKIKTIDKKIMIEGCDFRILTYKPKHKANIKLHNFYALEDLQGGNLANIESEIFESLNNICDRLEGSYFHDYILVAESDEFDESGKYIEIF